MAVYRSAQGKQVDMAALAARNERVRAVGNMSVNARGDTIDSHGRVIKPVTEKVSNGYAQTVGNRSANATKQPQRPLVPDRVKPVQPVPVEELILTPEEIELEESVDDIEIEKIKAKETGKK